MAERNPREPAPVDALVPTDFESHEDEILAWMLHRGAPDIVDELAQGWSMVGVALGERAHDLEIEYRRMSPSWTGQSAQHYENSVRSLITAIQRVGKMAGAMSDVMYANASALQQARSMYAPPEGFKPLENRPTVWNRRDDQLASGAHHRSV